MRARAFLPTPGFTFTYPQAEVKDHSANLGVLCGHYFETPSRCWLSSAELSLKKTKYPNFSKYLFDRMHWSKTHFPPARRSKKLRIQSRNYAS